MSSPIIRTITKKDNYVNDFEFNQLNELEHKTDWDTLVNNVFPFYVKSNIAPLVLTVENMLRIHILLRHFNLSPSEIENILFKDEKFRDFALIDLDQDEIPDASTITNFSSLLLDQDLAFRIEKHIRTH